MLSQTINPPKTYVQGIYKAPTCYHVSPRSRKSNTDSNFHSLSSPPPICFSLTPLCSLALMRRGKFICNTQAAQCPHTSEVQALAFCTDPCFPSLRGLPISLHNPLIQVTAINPLVLSTWRGQAHHSVVLSAQDPLLCLQQSQHLPLGLSRYSCCPRPQVPSSNGLCRLRSVNLVAVASVHKKKKKKLYWSANLHTFYTWMEKPHFFWPKLSQLCKKGLLSSVLS